MPRLLINAADAVEARLEAEFQRTWFPHISTMRNIAAETNKSLDYIKNWFREKRRGPVPNIPADANPTPAPVQAPARVPTRPTRPPVFHAAPRPAQNMIIVHGQPNWQLGNPYGRNVTVEIGATFNMVTTPFRTQRRGFRTVVYSEEVHFVLPQPNTCYPNNLVAGNDQHANDDISAEQEANFNRVLQIKLKCGICFSAQMTLRCRRCFKGVCNGCIVEMAKNVGGQQLACPYCRQHPNPFVAVSFPRV